MAESKRGRPPLEAGDRTVPVSLALPSKQYAELRQQAERDDVTVPEIIRRTLRSARGKQEAP